MDDAQFNDRLGQACRSCGVTCCKKGRLFLQPGEHAAMRERLVATRPEELADFDKRVENHGAFLVYDQKSGCQFLDADDLCTLHDEGLKPTECHWWPYHVFARDENSLEIRLSQTCCTAYKLHTERARYPALIAAQAREIGLDTLRSFRRIFPGERTGLLVHTIPAPSRVAELSP